MRFNLTRCRERGGSDDGGLAFFLRRRTTLGNPWKAVRVENRKDGIANACCLRSIDAQPRRRECGIGNRHKVVSGDWRSRQVAEGFLFVPAFDEVGNQLGVDRVSGDIWQLVDQSDEDRGELVEKSIVEVERLVNSLIPKCICRPLRVGLKFGERPPLG